MIGAINGTNATAQITGMGQRPDPAKAMAPVADLLGTDVESLREQLHGGTSLSELAEARGIDRQQLLDAISQGLQDAAPAGAAGPPGGIAGLAERIADRTGPPGPPGPPPGGRPPGAGEPSAGLASLAELLGTDEDTLREQLSSGLANLESLLGGSSAYTQDQTWSLRQGLGVDTRA
ncbi:hypothetical protein [Svornostia abyssi]|uniref:hypothetical protein n=1 Tax=Svornostia abyssi TaxID=2898438 RepID=UPI00338E6E37